MSGVRLTYVRRLILQVLQHAQCHLTATDIYQSALEADVDISLSTIYATIKVLADAGVIERRRFQTGKIHYFAGADIAHDQIIDIDSGRVIEFNNEALNSIKQELAKQYGLSSEDSHFEFYTHALEP